MTNANLGRREFLKTGAVAGASLVIGFHFPALTIAHHPSPSPTVPFKPNAWLEISPDGSVTIWTGRSEMGQGVRTTMPMIVAEGMEADWRRVRVMQAAAHPAYRHPATRRSRRPPAGWDPHTNPPPPPPAIPSHP